MLKRFNINIVKEALVLDTRSLKDKSENQKDNQYILVPIIELPAEWQKQR